jgi:small neutral amino acid transporter SnatA (MarC family)
LFARVSFSHSPGALSVTVSVANRAQARGDNSEGGAEMIHMLLVIAAVLFVLWLLFHATGALVNLIWLAIIVLVVIWLIGLVRGRSTTS